MFAPMILPLRLTLVLLATLTLLLALLLRRKSRHPLFFAVATSVILFLPILFGAMTLTNHMLYGTFEFEEAGEVRDAYVQVPDTATDLVVHRYSSFHAVRFRVGADELTVWMDELFQERQQTSDTRPFVLSETTAGQTDEFHNLFGGFGWTPPDDILVYRGWRSARGGGFDVWYSQKDRVAYMYVTYW